MHRFRTAAVWLLVLTLGELPALSRVHDRLSAADQRSGIELRKSRERPQEKPASAVAAAASSGPGGEPGLFARVVAESVDDAQAQPSFTPSALRAPPAR